MQCPACGAQIHKGGTSCETCGAPIVPPASPERSKAGLIIAVLVIAALLLVGCGAAGIVAVRFFASSVTDWPSPAGSAPEASQPDSAPLVGYATSGEAVEAQLANDGVSDWVFDLYDEGDGYAIYWAGPPESEYSTEYVLNQNGDGSWSIVETNALGLDGGVSGSENAP